MNVQWIMVMILLGICTIEDLITKKIHLIWPVICFIGGIIFQITYIKMNIVDVLGGIFVGLVLVIISILSHQNIGLGDGLLLMACGIYLGFEKNLILFWMATMMAGLLGIVLRFIFKKGKKYKMAFVPILSAASLILFMLTEV
ncbi:MAG: prepilin peptidase [Lachnospiraceae bacterium]|nr:prepilin peptidase [Lachnospiraceae bacterium]